MLRISQIKINISEFYKKNKEKIEEADFLSCYSKKEAALLSRKIASMLQVELARIGDFSVIKRSVDARKKNEIFFNYAVDVVLEEKLEKKLLAKEKKHRFTKSRSVRYQAPEFGEESLTDRPIVVGFGPAGMFCALELAKAGYAPLVLERGQTVDVRVQDVEHFWKTGELKENSNVQFGEGGAGTFSDGKLNTTVKDPTGRNRKVLEILVEHGAQKQILYMQKPHIGTDALCKIVKNIRKDIEYHCGEVRFGARVTDIRVEDGRVTAVQVNGEEWISSSVVVLAIGHSARDTFKLLYDRKIEMEQKPFAIGVRVEHKQKLIDMTQYGELGGILPAADYKLTYQASNGRSLFSFCMCPGGFVVDASSEENHLVVNGMSNQGRNEENANSAMVVNVIPEDFGSDHVLAGVEFQRKWEALAFKEGKGRVPVQLFGDFKEKRISKSFGEIAPVHKGNTSFGNLWNCLPEFVCETLREGIEALDGKIKGYGADEVLLSGVETRTSSPVKIPRNTSFECSLSGIYPCGEGAGYAGGITSAAIDGIKVYEAIRKKYRPMSEER